MEQKSFFLKMRQDGAENNLDRLRWKRLLDEINLGNVIPVIGPDLLVEPKLVMIKGEESQEILYENLHQQIISCLVEQTGSVLKTRPRTFSQLVYSHKYLYYEDNNGKPIYSVKEKISLTCDYINQFMENLDRIEGINREPSQLLVDLLSTKKFPFVITTSFTPIVEQVMKKVWGRVKVINFTNDPKDCKVERGGDIRIEADMKQPTVLYMLGRYCDNPQKYVVTDSDMMTFCGSWIKGGDNAPKNLSEALKKKYLLILGNSYSDWLYRFVWFSLRTTPNEMKSDVIVNEDAEETFIQFLERLETFYKDDPSEVVQRIKEEMYTRSDGQPLASDPKEYDVFISYSRRDSAIAKNLYEALTDKGLRVWIDQKSIETESWKMAQSDGVKRCRLFIPILTKNVANEVLDDHEYRSEWKIAHERSEKMGARPFIIPFAEQGFDFYNSLIKLPDSFKDQNGRFFSSDNDLEEITNVVIQALKKLEEMKNELQK